VSLLGGALRSMRAVSPPDCQPGGFAIFSTEIVNVRRK
jgi:hypothetical protein